MNAPARSRKLPGNNPLEAPSKRDLPGNFRDLALWAPLEVASLPASVAFYTNLGLPVLETFDGGVVFSAGPGGRIEVVAPRTPSPPPPVALELASWAAVDAVYERVGGDAPPSVFPRGHYGFVARDPDGNPLLIWSEQ